MPQPQRLPRGGCRDAGELRLVALDGYQATGGFTLLVSGGGSSGSVSIPVTCPVGPGPTSYVTVKAVASNPNGSAAAYYWGL